MIFHPLIATSTPGLHPVDWLMLAAYVVAVLALWGYYARRQKTLVARRPRRPAYVAFLCAVFTGLLTARADAPRETLGPDETVAAVAGTPAKTLLDTAAKLADRGFLHPAIQFYEAVLARDADTVDPAVRRRAQIERARCFENYDQFPEAAAAYASAAEMCADDPDPRVEFLYRQGLALEKHHDFEGAKRAFEQAVAVQGAGRRGGSFRESARVGMLRSLRQLGRPEEALRQADTLLEKDMVSGRNVVHTHFEAARALQDLGKHREAIERYENSGAVTGYDPGIAKRGITRSREALAGDEETEAPSPQPSPDSDTAVLNWLLASLGHPPADEAAGFRFAGVDQSSERAAGGSGDLYADEPRNPVDIGTRTELMVDRFLVDSARNLTLALHPPQRREVVLRMELPWERPAKNVAYVTVFRDGDTIRMYYRAHGDRYCFAESRDGIHFTKPALSRVPYGEEEQTNIILEGPAAHNFAPFKDPRPDVPEPERYKAIGGRYPVAFQSADGIAWKKMRGDERLLGGRLDSQNVVFWDSVTERYRAFSRLWASPEEEGGRRRLIRINESDGKDFFSWSDGKRLEYPPNTPLENLYTSAVHPVPGAEHLLAAFPRRFVHGRRKVPYAGRSALGDTVFMTSRDGIRWDRSFREAWLRPGPDFRNWTSGGMVAWGIVYTGPDEMSLYVNQHAGFAGAHLRRLTLPRHRFASFRAGYEAGELVTRPLRFEGRHLILNYRTSAAGTVFVGLRTGDGEPIEGFSLKEADPLYGDAFDTVVSWNGENDLSSLEGRPVRLRILMQDADLYSLRFAPDPQPQSMETK